MAVDTMTDIDALRQAMAELVDLLAEALRRPRSFRIVEDRP